MVKKGKAMIEISEKRKQQLKNAKKVFGCSSFDEVIGKLQKRAIPHMLDEERFATKHELLSELV